MPTADDISGQAKARFFAVSTNMPLIDVAELMSKNCDLLLVLTAQDRLCGVISKAALITCLARHGSFEKLMVGEAAVAAYSCTVTEELDEVWRRMFINGWKSLPLLSKAGLPIGIVTARDVIDGLIKGGSDETSMLPQYFHSF